MKVYLREESNTQGRNALGSHQEFSPGTQTLLWVSICHCVSLFTHCRGPPPPSILSLQTSFLHLIESLVTYISFMELQPLNRHFSPGSTFPSRLLCWGQQGYGSYRTIAPPIGAVLMVWGGRGSCQKEMVLRTLWPYRVTLWCSQLWGLLAFLASYLICLGVQDASSKGLLGYLSALRPHISCYSFVLYLSF